MTDTHPLRAVREALDQAIVWLSYEGHGTEVNLCVEALAQLDALMASHVLVPKNPHPDKMPNYIAGLWSRRNLEALLEDLAASPAAGERGSDAA